MTDAIDMDGFITSPEIRARAQKVLDYLRADPRRHNQSSWFISRSASTDWHSIVAVLNDQGELNICGTQMCLAGTVMFQEKGIKGLRAFDRNERKAWHEAAVLLGLGEHIAYNVFHQTGNAEALAMIENIADGVHPYTDVKNWSDRL